MSGASVIEIQRAEEQGAEKQRNRNQKQCGETGRKESRKQKDA